MYAHLGLPALQRNPETRPERDLQPLPEGAAINCKTWLDEQASICKKNFFETRVIEYQTWAQLEL